MPLHYRGVDGLVGGGGGKRLSRHFQDDAPPVPHCVAPQSPMTTSANRVTTAEPSSLAIVCFSVFDVRLVDQHTILVPAVEATLDDLGQRRIGLALVAGDLLDRGPLGVDLGRRHLVAGDVARPGEGDVGGDVVGQGLVAAPEGDDDRVDAATGLHVEIGVDRTIGLGLDAHAPRPPRCSPSGWSAAGRSRPAGRPPQPRPWRRPDRASSSARLTKSSDLATKSVSDFSSTMAALFPSLATATAPSVASRPERLSALPSPCTRSHFVASSMSPPDACRARLASSMPAPEA